VTRPQPYTEALQFSRHPLTPEQRGDAETLALRLATDRSGAAFGEAAELAQLVCALGAEREHLQGRVDAFLREWDRPHVSSRGWSADLDRAVCALRGAA
jgi:broad specificity phosphatase PhoE